MSERDKDRVDDSALGTVLRAVGRGPALSPASRARIYKEVRARWAAALAPARPGPASAPVARQRRARWLPLAAAFAGAAVLVLLLRMPSGAPGELFATVVRAEGPATIERDGRSLGFDGGGPTVLQVGDRLLTQPGGRLALELASGQQLRVDSSSDLRVDAAASIQLAVGAVYFDSQGLERERFDIGTPIGSVSHVGTQYEASISAARLRVRVREGAAAVSTTDRALEARAGEQLQINAEGDVIRAAFAADDPAWSWVEGLAVIDVADTHNLHEILRWISRETGVALQFDDAVTEARASDVEVAGLAGFDPREALEAITSATAFGYRVDNSRLLVTAGPP